MYLCKLCAFAVDNRLQGLAFHQHTAIDCSSSSSIIWFVLDANDWILNMSECLVQVYEKACWEADDYNSSGWFRECRQCEQWLDEFICCCFLALLQLICSFLLVICFVILLVVKVSWTRLDTLLWTPEFASIAENLLLMVYILFSCFDVLLRSLEIQRGVVCLTCIYSLLPHLAEEFCLSLFYEWQVLLLFVHVWR